MPPPIDSNSNSNSHGVYDSHERREIDKRKVNNRKRANSNYFELETSNNKGNPAPNDLRLRTSFLNLCNEGTTATSGDVHEDEYAFDLCCEYLGKRYGFQRGSIDNQKEHIILLATNFKARYSNPKNHRKLPIRNVPPEQYYLAFFHYKLFGNYHEWCNFLHTKPHHFREFTQLGYPNVNPMYMDITLYFLIWGEAANIRHMPECICYLYHQMAEMLNSAPVLTSKNVRGEDSFLYEIVQPIWKQCSVMLKKDKHGKQLEHTRLRNYDDNNEFFWCHGCFAYTPYNVSRGLQSYSQVKTFYEHRSLTSLLLNYYRIFQFNIMFFIVLTILAFLVAISPSGGQNGLMRFGSIGQVVTPFTNRDKNLAIASFFMSHAILAFIKCLLEITHGWHIILSSFSVREGNSEDKAKSLSYIGLLIIRLLWNGLFSFLFGVMVLFSKRFSFSESIYSSYFVLGIIFILPGFCTLMAQAFAASWLVSTSASKFIREGETCYVGRNLNQGYYFLSQYAAFWIILWIMKALVSFFLLVGPLMLPSIAIYNMDLTHRTNVVSFHNIGVIISLWLPVFCVFLYDTQIYFTIFQAIVGGYKGIKMKSGEFRGIQQISNAFRIAPQLFDQKIVSKLASSSDQNANLLAAQGGDGGSQGQTMETFQSQLMLRFVVVWNEIVNSFREGDLVDDKEAAILQYDIQSTGEVFEPVFLSAGKCGEAITMAVKLAKSNKLTDSELRIFLVENDCLSAIKSFFNAMTIVIETLLSSDDIEVAEGIHMIYEMISHGGFMKSFNIQHIIQLRAVVVEFLEAILDLPDPDTPRSVTSNQRKQDGNADNNEVILVHSLGTVRNFVNFMDSLLHCLQQFCFSRELGSKFSTSNISFLNSSNNYSVATYGLLNLFHSDVAMGAATRAYLLLSLEKQDSMPRCTEARRRLGFFMKSLLMDIPQIHSISEMHSFSVMTPYYSETVIFSLKELNNPLENHPVFKKVEEGGKNITILKYLTTCYPVEWENFLERIDVANIDMALDKYPQEVRLWASYHGQTLARTVQGMMLYEDAIKILHWLEIGSSTNKTTEEKQIQLENMVKLKFSYICACQVYGKHRKENKQEADDIDFLLSTYPNLRVAYVDTIPGGNGKEDEFDTVLIKAEDNEVLEVYRYHLPGNPVLGEGKPENQNNAIPFSRGEFLQTIDMNQQHYFEECLKMPQLLETSDFHPTGLPVSIIGMREHIFTGNASSLAKFKTWQELVFVTLSQRVLADPLCVRMHYGHPDVFDKILTITRGGVSKASKGINLSEDVYAGYNISLRGGTVTHVEFMQCGKGRDVALSQISMFEAKLANGCGETSLSREAHRMGQFFDFFRLNSMYYSHTGFYFATWLTIVTTFIYMYCKLYVTLIDVQEDIVMGINSTDVISKNWKHGFDTRLLEDFKQVSNTQYLIQAGLFLTLPLLMVYFTEMGLLRGIAQFLEMVFTLGPAFFVFQVGTTAHYFDNNIVHGGAKYQATGRGFKITRETFILLYKAYCHSHYKKAFELIGLCIIYLSFGNFQICDKTSNTSFGHKFCSSGQSYGSQTFAIWFIAVIWLLAPFVFNTDGLDWAKTCVDIAAWSKWMFMNENEEDEDKTTTGGWMTWWKNDLDNLKTTKNVARLSVIIRELRHFVVLWYVVTLKFPSKAVVMVLLAVVLSFVLFSIFGIFGLAFHFSSHTNKTAVTRASIYLVLFLGAVIGYFLVMSTMYGWALSKCLALFFGYFAGLYGASEMLRVCNFPYLVIYNSYPVQQVAFFFDFLFGFVMIVPLFILSGIPFMNVIQTRMMYNEGFSKVMSASSQYAYSLAAYVGLLGGSACGWLLYVLTTLDSSPDFISYITAYELNINAGKGIISGFVLVVAACGTFICGGLAYVFGRRINISIAGALILIGVVTVGAIPQVSNNASTPILYGGLGLIACGLGIIMPMIWLYIFEISTKDTKTKTMLLLCFGIVIGSLCGSYFTLKDKSIGWVWQLFQASVMIALITPVINIFPESPLWVMQKQGVDAAQSCLATLRRKQDVSTELKEIIDANDSTSTQNTEYLCSAETMYKGIISVLLQIVIAFSLVPISDYMAFGIQGADKLFLSQCIGLELLGLFLAFFFIDRISHRAVILSTFLPILACVALLAANDTKTFWTELVYTQIFASFIYLFQGLGVFSVCWVNCIGIFISTNSRTIYTIISFVLFFFVPVGSLYIRLNLDMKPYYILYAYAAVLLFITLLIGMTMSYRISDGTICTKDERRTEEKVVREQRERANRSGLRTPGSARNRNLSRSRSKSQNRSNYHLYESPAAKGRNVRVFT